MSEKPQREPYVATYEAHEWKAVTIKGDARVERIVPGDSRRPANDHEPDSTLYRVSLYSGSLHRYHAERHDEGHSYVQEEVDEGEDADGSPCWIILNESGGRDCDGPIARYWKGVSYGGLEPGAWYSPSAEVSSSVYDAYARAAGY